PAPELFPVEEVRAAVDRVLTAHGTSALQYSTTEGYPPLRDLIAQRIKSIAQENNVPIVEDKPLAQMLYKTVEVGEEIPEKLFQVVAQVLAYVYRLRESRKSMFSVN
ncbi:hypothetical protein FBQ87_09725, partial [Sphingobacteriales bacterium CHB3]|nr:hypothetical protein [Sphingobacteriales bacterium CHB3]